MTTIDNIFDPPEPPAPSLPTLAPSTDPDAVPEIESAVGNILFNMTERVARTIKKGHASGVNDALPLVLEDRRDYIENPLSDAMPGANHGNVSTAADMLTNAIIDRDIAHADDLKPELIRVLTDFCANITQKNTGDA